jgi:hypothetical protein
MKKKTMTALLALGLATPAAAQKMPLTSFLARSTALQNKGPLALLQQGEISALQNEIKGAGMALKAERDAAAKTGGKGPFCPPAGQSSVAMKSQDLMNELKAIPAAQAKAMTVTDGLRVVLGKRYPCR